MNSSTIDISKLKNTIGSLSTLEIRKVLFALINDKPEFYYMFTSRVGVGRIVYNWSISTTTVKQRIPKSNMIEIENIANSVALQANKYSNDYNKIIYVHNWICNNMTYSISGSISIDGFTTGSGLCQSYAHMFQYIMNKLNIDCLSITGTAKGGRHTWNHVKLNNNWYLVDTCWDDSSDSYHYNYFLKGKSALTNRSTSYSFPALSSSDY